MLNKGTVLSDRYEVIERIGTGGMADVYKAIDHKLNRYVAIKVLKSELREDTQFISKFRQEAQSVAVLSHPNIVNVYDVGNEGNVYYIVMELVEGITLKKYIEKKGHLPYREAVAIAIQVANGIEAAHKQGIIHRDIKPQNIIISKDGKVKVTDFGIAKAVTAATVTTAAMGSVHYMSPEQARGGYSDARSDIYSFGITLYEMLTGQVPFDGDTTVAVAVHHIQDDIPAPSESTEGIPLAVDQIVNKCTRRKVDQRYQDVEELKYDMRRALDAPNHNLIRDNYEEEDAMASDMPRRERKLAKEPLPDIEGTQAIPNISNRSRRGTSNNKKSGLVKWIVAAGVAIAVIIIAVVFISKNSNDNKPEETTTIETTTQTETTTETTNATEAAIKIPNIVKMDYYEAKKKLEDMGLVVDREFRSSSSVASGSVISSNPSVGQEVKKGEKVILYVSSGATTITVPDLRGMTYKEVDDLGHQMGFYFEASGDEDGVVISQSPAEGGTVTKSSNDPVRVVFKNNKPSGETTTSNSQSTTTKETTSKSTSN